MNSSIKSYIDYHKFILSKLYYNKLKALNTEYTTVTKLLSCPVAVVLSSNADLSVIRRARQPAA